MTTKKLDHIERVEAYRQAHGCSTLQAIDAIAAQERSEQTAHTPGPWDVWHSGYANAPFIVYWGDKSPRLDAATGRPYLPPHLGVMIGEVYHDESPEH